MDFYKIKQQSAKNGVVEIYPDFKVCRTKDLMVRAKSFYAIWDEENQIWSKDEFRVQTLVDKDLMEYYERIKKNTDSSIFVKKMEDFSTNQWIQFKKYINNISDNSKNLDEKLTFSNTDITKKDYVSKRLPYPLKKGDYSSWDELVGTLYSKEERAKIEWAIGAIVAGDSRHIQKFLVLYGEAGAGKSTILNIIQKLFEGYYTVFEAKSLTSSSNSFSTEAFKDNPLVAIQHDGDLSKIEDNTKLNSIISHEDMLINEKFKPSYMSRINAFLFMATNRPVKITDAKSGIIRRLIDVKPSGEKVSPKRYQVLMSQIDFELGAIAYHCLDVYRKMGKNYYSTYKPVEMMFKTDVFYNFVEENYLVFKEQDGISSKQAYQMYKEYCTFASVAYQLPYHAFREELKNYFGEFHDMIRIDGKQYRSYYSKFLENKFEKEEEAIEEHQYSLVLDSTESIFDEECVDCLAQYANKQETPMKKWAKVKTKLKDIDTSKLHYVKVPLNHIVIDFDLKDDKGNKSLELNMAAASKWPATYSETSKGGNGLHLHYIYDGDVDKLSRVYSEGIEVKVFVGDSSLRRKLTKCNNIPIMTISSGLPLKGEHKMINFEAVKNEKALRTLIENNLRKEYHPGTKPSIDFIFQNLKDAYDSGLNYDVRDLRPRVLAFAANSTNQSQYCVKIVGEMQFASDEASMDPDGYKDDEPLVFYDVEVFPNLFVVVWKYQGDNNKPVIMINPTPQEIEELLRMKLVGFNCRRYDNHILYGRFLGYSLEQLYELSQKIINNSPNAMFMEAYKLSYTDIYDFSNEKQSLKKFEIDLGIHHEELGLPWDEPVPEELWDKVGSYCCNDVIATEATFNARKADWVARQILAKLAGLSVNDSTQKLTAKIIFGDDKNPQSKFIYTDLSKEFPGYKFEFGKSTYKGIEVGEGGRVSAKPGMYGNVALLDIASMHPTTLEILKMFGEEYTKRFSEIKNARLAVKHGETDILDDILDGVIAQYLKENPDTNLDDLAYALKIAINIVYGLTSAKFDNPFKDPRNVDNICAKRGALFMIDLEEAIAKEGYNCIHVKTDSVKIADADEYIINFVMEYGKKYGYTFEHEATYDKICLVNDAVYIAKYKTGKQAGEWVAVGTQFQHPYVFKTLFSKETLEFRDLCEARQVKTAIYLLPTEQTFDEWEKSYKKMKDTYDFVNLQFIGKVGNFCPVKKRGGILLRENNRGGYDSVTKTKGYKWMEAEQVKILDLDKKIDMGYFNKLVDEAVKSINEFGDFEWFASEDPYNSINNKIITY